MTRSRHTICCLGVAVVAMFATARAAAPLAAQSLGQARLPSAVLANGQRLAAGTYAVRVTNAPVTPVVGQTPAESRWVEFVQGDAVRGRELATVLTPAELAKISAGRRVAPGATRVDLLRGGDYVRVWFNQDGTHYLVHLAVAP